MTIDQKEAELKNLLYDMSASVLKEEDLEKLFGRLETVYRGDYRHCYSSLFSTVEEISDSKTYSRQCLLENLQALKGMAESRQLNQKVKKSIFKFYDHVTLELLRLDHYDQIENTIKAMGVQIQKDKELLQEYSQQLEESKNKLKTAEEALKEADENLKEATKKTKNFQAEIIGIISIFAAVTLAFSGGLSYLSSAISAVHNSPVLKLILTILICGFVLFNTIFILLYVVARIIDKNIFFRCNSKGCENCIDKKKERKCSFVKKIKKSLPYLFWVDVILIAMIILVVAGMIYRKSPSCPDWLK